MNLPTTTPQTTSSCVVTDIERREARVFCKQGHPAIATIQAFYQALTIDKGDDDVPVPRPNAFIDDQDIAVENLRPLHRFPLYCEKEGRDWIANQVFVDIEALVFIVGSRTGEAR